MRIEPKKHGTNLVIQKKDGRQISGELIAVKENSLLLLDSESGADVSVDIKDIKVIKMKKSMTRLGMGIGCVAGVLTGLGSAKALSDLHDGIDSQWYLILPLICAVPLSFLGGIILLYHFCRSHRFKLIYLPHHRFHNFCHFIY